VSLGQIFQECFDFRLSLSHYQWTLFTFISLLLTLCNFSETKSLHKKEQKTHELKNFIGIKTVFSATPPPTISVYVNYYLLLVCAVRSHTKYDRFNKNKHTLYSFTEKNSAILFVEIYSQSEYTKAIFSFPVVLGPLMGRELPLSKLRDLTHTQTPHSAGLLWTRDLYLTTHNIHKRHIHAHSARIEPAIPVCKRQQIHRAATRINSHMLFCNFTVL
jgi:hypothetical protein